MCNCWLESINT